MLDCNFLGTDYKGSIRIFGGDISDIQPAQKENVNKVQFLIEWKAYQHESMYPDNMFLLK